MSFSQQRRTIAGDTPGASHDLVWYRCGDTSSGRKVYLQSALHADEHPGTMLLHHLLPMLREADERDALRAEFIVVPMVNPLGMASFSFRTHLGRYDANTGLNHNRRWPDLAGLLAPDIGGRLGNDPARNVLVIRAAVADWLAAQIPATAAQELRLAVLALAHDADIVLDLHCDSDSLMHIFTSTDLAGRLADLGAWMGAAAILTADDSGGGSFDEMLPALYRAVAVANPDRPVPLACAAATLEYRGLADIDDATGLADAEALMGFFAGRGLVDGRDGALPRRPPPVTPLAATEIVRAGRPGLLAYRVELGERVARGQPIADIIALDGPEAFLARTPVVAGTDGLVLSRRLYKVVRRGESIAKIVGTEPLPGRGTYLLED